MPDGHYSIASTKGKPSSEDVAPQQIPSPKLPPPSGTGEFVLRDDRKGLRRAQEELIVRILLADHYISPEEKVKKILGGVDLEMDERTNQHRQLGIDSQVFFDILQKYLDCRTQMDAKYEEVDQHHSIAKFQLRTDSGGIETSSEDPLEFKEQYQQQSKQGTAVKTIEELYEAAPVAFEVYKQKINELVKSVCEACGDDVDSVQAVFAPLKGKERAQEKANDDYGDRKPSPGVSWLYDIVRGSIKFASTAQILKCMEIVGADPTMHVLKAKNRFEKPTLTGYRDVNLCIRIVTQEGFYHICEVQIHHKAIKSLDESLGSHKYYEYFRTYFSGSTGTLQERLEDLKEISGGDPLDPRMIDNLLERSSDETRLERLARLFAHQVCEYQPALVVYGRLLEIQILKHETTNHKDVASTMKCMAQLLEDQGRFDDALHFLLFVFEIDKEILPRICPAAASTLLSIGKLFYRKREFDQAMEVSIEALTIFKTVSGDSSSAVAHSYNHIGAIMLEQGNFEGSKECLEKAHSISMELEEEPIAIADIALNLSVVHHQLGNVDKAIVWTQNALAVKKKHLGDDHVDVAVVYNNLAKFYSAKNKNDEAVAMLRKCLEIKTKKLGAHHHSLATNYFNLAGLLEEQKKLKAAEECYELSLKIDKRAHGEFNPIIAHTYLALSKNLRTQKRFSQSIDSLRSLIDVKRRANEQVNSMIYLEFAETLKERASQMAMFQVASRKEAALLDYRDAISIWKQYIHPENGHVANLYREMAYVEMDLGLLDTAMKSIDNGMPIAIKALGEEHGLVAGLYAVKAEVHEKRGQLEQALSGYQKSLLIAKNIPDMEAKRVSFVVKKINSIQQQIMDNPKRESAASLVRMEGSGGGGRSSAFDNSIQEARDPIGLGRREELSKSVVLKNIRVRVADGNRSDNHMLVQNSEEPSRVDDLLKLEETISASIKLMKAGAHERVSDEAMKLIVEYNKIGQQLFQQGKFEDSLKANEKLLSFYEILSQVEGMQVSPTSFCATYNNMAAILQRQGQPAKAKELIQRQLDRGNRCAYNALNQMRRGQWSEALSLYKESLEWFGRHVSEDSQFCAVYSNISSCYSKMGNHEEALTFAQKSLAIRKRTCSPNDPKLGISYHNCAMSMQNLGRLDEAISAFQIALKIKRHLNGGMHSSVALTCNTMAATLVELKRYEEAMELYRESLDIYMCICPLGESDSAVADVFTYMASCLEKQGNLTEALSMLRKAEAIYDEHFNGAKYKTTVSDIRRLEQSILSYTLAWAVVHNIMLPVRSLSLSIHPYVNAVHSNPQLSLKR